MSTSATKTPVYFVSHGGPNVMFETEHPAYKALQNIGKEITQKVKPKAVVVFSAHWQAGKTKVEVNEAEVTKLIYDYYGFPDNYYKIQYPNVGSKDLANKILTLFKEAGIEAEGTKRGLDHGVFAPFTCMFNPDENPLGVPLVQVSLFNNEDPDKHYELGAALRKLREENILIIGSGMAVHNLRDLFFAMREGSELPYAKVFDAELKKAVINPANGEDRKKSLNTLLQHKSARQAHPTFEHLLPVHIAAGAAGDDKAEQLFTMTEMSLSWAQYRFGDKPKAQ
ncbi:Extradiol ring-cleavage dioxygenase, class III enzyme, subunit B [Pyronema omphalodes]|nr:Extradiol ring-cleavage dioxygenase, class III enzyme, subunit B [Pyronema omphalodes]